MPAAAARIGAPLLGIGTLRPEGEGYIMNISVRMSDEPIAANLARKVTVVGAGGHVGLPLSLVLANRGHFVHGLEINASVNDLVMSGHMPFSEQDGSDLLRKALDSKRLNMTSDLSVIQQSDVVVIIIGTPIDENHNPRVDHLLRFFEEAKPYLNDQVIILRSTVSPGTTDAIRQALDPAHRSKLTLVFAPERVLQGRSIHEIQHLPQLIGAYNDKDYERAAEFFRSFIFAETIRLLPIEAELGKLITNMARYVGFALANEFHLICDSFDANTCRVIDACNKDYPRLNLPVPGPNVGGPCLSKDGWYLVEQIPYNELISSSFRINESMTMQILRRIEARITGKKVAILGMAFKANNDDIRNSLSFKMRRQLQFKGYDIVCVDPHVKGFSERSDIVGSDAVILMTPHDEFKELKSLLAEVANPECWFVDLWGHWSEMRHLSKNGYFQAKEVKAKI
jgi:UDP-N-acetyl-D-mannosaminuronic acid dehydrogenase